MQHKKLAWCGIHELKIFALHLSYYLFFLNSLASQLRNSGVPPGGTSRALPHSRRQGERHQNTPPLVKPPSPTFHQEQNSTNRVETTPRTHRKYNLSGIARGAVQSKYKLQYLVPVHLTSRCKLSSNPSIRSQAQCPVTVVLMHFSK